MRVRPPRHPVLALIWKIGSIIVGVLLLVFGIIGLFLPVLQGVAMIIGGLAILSAYSPMAKRLLTWMKEKIHFHHKTDDGQRPGPPADSETIPEKLPEKIDDQRSAGP